MIKKHAAIMTLIYFMRGSQRLSIQEKKSIREQGRWKKKNLFKLDSYNQVINQSWVIVGIAAAHRVLITLATPPETEEELLSFSAFKGTPQNNLWEIVVPYKLWCFARRISSTTKIKQLALENFSYFHSDRANFSSVAPNRLLNS